MQGFTLIEVLIAVFVVTAVTVSVSSLGLLLTRTSIESERQTVAQGIANEQMEIARTYAYAQLEEKIEPNKTVQRNNQTYAVESHVTYIDDPLTKETRDFKQLTVNVSWPRAREGVTLASFFVGSSQKKSAGDGCIPGTVTCPDPKGPPAPFLLCPASGKCSDHSVNLSLPVSPILGQSPNPTLTPLPAWCSLIQSAPFAESNLCSGELVIEDCTATCPSYRRLGQLGKVPICGQDAYCVITSFSYERCPCNGD